MHVFTGQEQAAKDWECVLIYDEELGVSGRYSHNLRDDHDTLTLVDIHAGEA